MTPEQIEKMRACVRAAAPRRITKKRIKAHAAYYSDSNTLYTKNLTGVPGQKFFVLPAEEEAYWAMIVLGRLALLGLPNKASRNEQVKAIAAAWGIKPPRKVKHENAQ